MPTESCTLDLEIEPPPPTPNPLPPICTQRLIVMGLFIFGINCEDSNVCEGNQETCEDFNGGPAGYDFDELYARVYGQNEFGFWLFNGPIDDEFGFIEINRPDFTRLPADLVVELYRNGDDPFSFPLQNVTFHSSCSQPLICFNSFGSSTIAFFENEEQGRVNCSSPETVDVTIEIPINLPQDEDAVTVIRATMFSNFSLPNIIDLGLTGQRITAGTSVTTEVEINFNPALDFVTFGGDFLIIARTDLGRTCTGEGTVTFDVPGREFGFITCPPVDSPAGPPDRW